MSIINSIFSQYFYLRQIIPFFLYVFYFIFRDVDNPFIDALVKTGLVAIILGTAYTIMGYILGIDFKELISFTWAYQSPITWGLLFISYYYILTRKENNPLTSFTISTLAVMGGGWLYEVPFFHPLSMFMGRGSFFYINIQIICLLLLAFELRKKTFNPNPIIYATLFLCMFLAKASFYYPNSQILCLIFLAYELKKMNFKPNMWIWSTLILFMALSMPLFMDMRGFWRFVRKSLGSLDNLVWIYRIPTSLFLLSLLSGVKKND